MNKRIPFVGFVSPLGRHTHKSFINDIGLKSASKVMNDNNASTAKKFSDASSSLSNAQKALNTLNFLGKVYIGLAHNGNNSLTNSSLSTVPFLTESSETKLGVNNARYIKIKTHIGRESTNRVKKMASTAFIESLKVNTADSQSDYLTSAKRKQLVLKSGFNEKLFTFFLDDTYYTVQDYYKLFDIDKRFKAQISNNKDGNKEIWGCALKTYHQFKFKNKSDYFTAHVKIHLVKISKYETDVRSLIKDITSHVSSEEFSDSGKIPRDFQLTDPKFSKDNNISTSFLTTLNCSLTDSSRFKENCKIVRTWSRSLSPGSIFDFTLVHHLGRGINLNQILNLMQDSKSNSLSKDYSKELDNLVKNFVESDSKNTLRGTVKNFVESIVKLPPKSSELQNLANHPTGYIFVLEAVGDRRASIVNKTNDSFSGYSPVMLQHEFKTGLSYLAQDSDNANQDLLVYKYDRKKSNFPEGSPFEDIFYPDRESKFHVPFDSISFGGFSKNKEWSIEYDSVLKQTSDSSDSVGLFSNVLDSLGLHLDNIGPDGISLNFAKGPSKSDEDDQAVPSSAPLQGE